MSAFKKPLAVQRVVDILLVTNRASKHKLLAGHEDHLNWLKYALICAQDRLVSARDSEMGKERSTVAQASRPKRGAKRKLAVITHADLNARDGSAEGVDEAQAKPVAQALPFLVPSSLRVVDLRRELRARGLASSGLKAQLVARLDEALAAEACEGRKEAELPEITEVEDEACSTKDSLSHKFSDSLPRPSTGKSRSRKSRSNQPTSCKTSTTSPHPLPSVLAAHSAKSPMLAGPSKDQSISTKEMGISPVPLRSSLTLQVSAPRASNQPAAIHDEPVHGIEGPQHGTWEENVITSHPTRGSSRKSSTSSYHSTVSRSSRTAKAAPVSKANSHNSSTAITGAPPDAFRKEEQVKEPEASEAEAVPTVLAQVPSAVGSAMVSASDGARSSWVEDEVEEAKEVHVQLMSKSPDSSAAIAEDPHTKASAGIMASLETQTAPVFAAAPQHAAPSTAVVPEKCVVTKTLSSSTVPTSVDSTRNTTPPLTRTRRLSMLQATQAATSSAPSVRSRGLSHSTEAIPAASAADDGRPEPTQGVANSCFPDRNESVAQPSNLMGGMHSFTSLLKKPPPSETLTGPSKPEVKALKKAEAARKAESAREEERRLRKAAMSKTIQQKKADASRLEQEANRKRAMMAAKRKEREEKMGGPVAGPDAANQFTCAKPPDDKRPRLEPPPTPATTKDPLPNCSQTQSAATAAVSTKATETHPSLRPPGDPVRKAQGDQPRPGLHRQGPILALPSSHPVPSVHVPSTKPVPHPFRHILPVSTLSNSQQLISPILSKKVPSPASTTSAICPSPNKALKDISNKTNPSPLPSSNNPLPVTKSIAASSANTNTGSTQKGFLSTAAAAVAAVVKGGTKVTKTGVRVSPGDPGYEISDREASSDDEDSETEEHAKVAKKVPEWAKGQALKQALEAQYNDQPRRVDPDKIFSEVRTCDLEEIFRTFQSQNKKRTYRLRQSTGNWKKDELTSAEKVRYRQEMGY